MLNIFDTHAHYAEYNFDEDRDELLASLPQKGVKKIILASSCINDCVLNMQIAEKYDYIYTSVGVHPEYANEVEDDFIKKLYDFIPYKKIKAIGEIGLDYHYEGYDKQKQIYIFENQLELAKINNFPVIIHSRNATEDTLKILKKYRPSGVVHCFSGSAETAKEILSLGMYISFTGVITFKNAVKAIKALESIPIDKILLETDCPFMAPVPWRGKRCDSSMIISIAEKVAEIKKITVNEVLDITYKSACELFKI